MSDQTSDKCPLCLSNMDLTDKQLKPCKCGYEICLWCWHRIIDESGGRCPGCRSVYNKDEILARNQILKELPADKSNYQKDQTKSHKQTSSKVQLGQSETKDPNSIRVIQRKLVYIVGMPTEFASEKLLRQKSFLGQYGKIENIIIDNIGANQQIPDSGRVYVTFAKEEEAVRCIQAVDGYTLDGRPLKATFGVTRYCHIWLSNRVCYKPNCSYVHYKASAEDICTKDDVSVVCARLQHLMGMSTKCLQHRSGRTFPPPGCCSSKNITCNGISKDLCINNDRLLPNGANKNTSLLPATTPWDSSLSSGSPPSMTNMVLHQRNDHESIHNNQQSLSDVKSQKYIPPGGRNPSVNHMQHSCRPTEGTSPKSSSNTSLVSLGPKGHLYEHSGSKNDEYQASSQLRNDSSNSKQMNLAENGISDTLQQKTQYADVVSQGQVPSVRRFTVLGRPMMTSKATEPTKLTLIENEHGSCIANPVSHPVSQSQEQPAHLLASASVKSHAGVQKKDECTDMREKLVLGDHKQLPKTALSQRLTVAESMSSRTLPSNLSASNSKIQGSAGPHNLSDLNIKLAAQNQLPLVINQQSAPVSNAGIARASSCFSTPNRQASLTDGRRQNPTQGVNERLHNREIIRSGNVVSSRCSDSTMMSRPVGAVSSAPDRKERRQAYPPGFEKPQHSSDSTTSSACSGLYSASDSLVQGSCGATDQQGFTSWATDCQRDDGDVTQNLSVGISLPLSSTNTNQSRRQFPGTIFGWSNHPHFSFYPSALRHAHHKPEYRDGTTGYAVLSQGITSGMRGGMASTLLQQSIMSTGANGNADSGTNCPQVDISYPMYTLF